jgi:hypothetical protein
VATSFTQYRGHGFWTTDAKLEIWLHLLVRAVDRLPEREPWLSEAREDWHLGATVGFSGCVPTYLDEVVGVAPRIRLPTMLALAGSVQNDLQRRQSIPRQELADAGVGGHVDWTRDVDTALVLPVARAVIDLLMGDLTWDAATSPVI